MNLAFSMDERMRLEALRRYRILDTAPEPQFDDITLLATEICKTPMSAITLVDSQRQWFKSRIGIPVPETPRENAFCNAAIRQRELFIVEDARADARFADSPMVSGEPFIRFYAGAPLVTSDDFVLGTLCVLDRVPRELGEEQKLTLCILGRQVVAQLELKRHLDMLAQALRDRDRYEDRLRHSHHDLEQLERRANFDALTSLANRNVLKDRIRHAIASVRRFGGFATVGFMDLDNFKFVNDSLGHAVGDKLLKRVAERLTACLRGQDTIARYGGDEFAFVLHGQQDEESVAVLMARILKTIEQPFSIEGNKLFASCSIGLSFYPKDGKDVETLLKNADAAMYRAKDRGRSNFQFYTPAMNRRATERSSPD